MLILTKVRSMRVLQKPKEISAYLQMICMAAVIKLLHISGETEEHELDTIQVYSATNSGLYGQVLCTIRAVHCRTEPDCFLQPDVCSHRQAVRTLSLAEAQKQHTTRW